MKTFFLANQAEYPECHKYMAAVEGIGKLLENMTFFLTVTVKANNSLAA
jgi:hypothetical protein